MFHAGFLWLIVLPDALYARLVFIAVMRIILAQVAAKAEPAGAVDKT
jgi:hypothetical protein